jgi:glycine/D-amino acid oxidase-like deaminating enzyme
MGSAASAPRGPPNISFRCEALIVGAGITGVLVVVRLTRQGLDVVLIDRESPGQGSTAASTAMLLWEIDRSLTEPRRALRSGAGGAVRAGKLCSGQKDCKP